MNICLLNPLRKLTTLSFAFSLGLSSSLLVAGPLNISNNALELAAGVDPNVMVLNDDSGSMDWSILVQGADQGLYATISPIAIRNYAYIQDDPENPNLVVIPSQNSLNNLENNNGNFWSSRNFNEERWRGVWRVLNNNFNSVYYNPNTQYKPWAGVDDNGNLFTNSNPSAARVDPYQSGSPTFDLTNDISYTVSMPHDTLNNTIYVFTDQNVYPARYYTWTDTDGDNNVDFDDAHQLIEIRTGGGCGPNAVCPTNFTRQGTREDCGGSSQSPQIAVTCTAEQELQNYANFYSYYRRRELTAKAAITRVLDEQTAIRVGYATINNNSNNRIQVQPMNADASTGNKRNLFDSIFETQSNFGTPLRQNLEAVGQYFSCENNNIFGTGNSAPGNADCPVFASPAGECQQNYTILLTDGFWNGNNPGIQNADGDGAGGTAQGPFDGASFADGFNRTLADVAMHYYERDIHGSLQDSVPTTTRDKSRYVGSTAPFELMHQHMSTYTVGIGVMGSRDSMPDDVNSNPASFNGGAQIGWPDPDDGDQEKIDDLRHAAWNGRGEFLSAANQTTLTSSLQNIFAEIQEGKGAASAVAFNSQDLQSGARIFRALFNASQNTGSLISQDISILGVIDPAIQWDAAELLITDAALAATAATVAGTDSTDSRVIITYNPVTFSGIPFQWSNLDATQKAKLQLPTVTSNPPTPVELGENRLEYLRGRGDDEGTNTNAGQFRERTFTENGPRFILGDIIHSAPVFVGAPPFSGLDQAPFPDTAGNLYSEFAAARSSRTELVYVGANDGMMHAFNANSGAEAFAYMPNSILSSITQLTDPNYAHRYFVDMTPAINDVYLAPTSGTNIGNPSWNTVAVTGLGIGAPGYFALNLTDPSNFVDEATAATNVMWEFTQADDVGGPLNNTLNLGSHIREPVIVMTNVDGTGGQKRWAAIFGNGYNSASADGDAELYIVFLDGGLNGTWTIGSDFVKINTGNGKAESSDGTTPNGLGAVQAIDIDSDGTADVVYAGDYQGNLYRFNISSTTVGGLTNNANRPVQELFQARYNSQTGPVQPITNRPAVTPHPTEDGYLIIIGTGSYFTVEDTSSTDLQSIYGIWDDFVSPSDNIVSVSYNRLLEQEFTSSGGVNGLTTRTLSNISIDYGTTGQRKQGWVIDLDVINGGSIEFPGERAVRNFLIRGDSAFVNSVIPKVDLSCSVGPGSFTISFKTENGGGGDTPVFDINNDGIFDSDDNVGATDGEGNIVAAVRSDTTTLTDSSTIGNRLVSQGGDQSISDIGINVGDPGGGETLGRHSWREIEN